MNLKIKAKSVKTGKWVYGYFMYDWDGSETLKPMIQELPNKKLGDVTSFTKVVIDKSTICRPTSIGAICGAHIFENDIVIYKNKGIAQTPALVVWSPSGFSTQCSINKELGGMYGFTFERIGNKFDNSELLLVN